MISARLALALGACVALAGCSGVRAAELRAETARPAASFVDSVGVNVHLSYYDTGYGKFAKLAPLIEELGVRHLRDGVVMGQQIICDRERELAAHGIRMTFITQTQRTAADLRSWASCVGTGTVEAYEAPNEYDISHPPNDMQWTQTLRRYQRTLYEAVKDDASLARVTVIGPSLTSPEAYRDVGDLSSVMDEGNMHNYFAGHNPGTRGWGLGDYGSIAYNLGLARIVDGSRPIAATETGYGTGEKDGVGEATQATYVPRMFLEQFNAGVVRTFEYELVDEGGPPYGTFGLVDANLVPKPSYVALQNLLHLLGRGDGASSSPTLRYAIDGAPADVHHALLAKGDGRFDLALWVEEPASPPVAARRVTLRFERPVAATLYRYDAALRLQPSSLHGGREIALDVGDRVEVVELTADGAR